MTQDVQARIDRFTLPHPGGGPEFQISVWANEDQGGEDMPVLFVTDADLLFGPAAELARFYSYGGQPTAMVVGVGYGTRELMAFSRARTVDLSPPIDEGGRAGYGPLMDLLGDNFGGAETFLGFLTDTLLPEIAARYPRASTGNRALFGHSIGGMFSAYALLKRPEAFAAFMVSSPALNWNNSLITSLLSDFPARVRALARKPRVLVGVGGKEQDLLAEVPESSDMSLEELHAMIQSYRVIDASGEFAAALRGAGLEEVQFTTFPGEDHITVCPAMLMRSIGFFMLRSLVLASAKDGSYPEHR